MSYNKMMVLTLRAKRNQIKSIILICQYILYICIYFKQMSFSVKLFAPCKLACPCCCWQARQQDELCLPQQLTYSWQGKNSKDKPFTNVNLDLVVTTKH